MKHLLALALLVAVGFVGGFTAGRHTAPTGTLYLQSGGVLQNAVMSRVRVAFPPGFDGHDIKLSGNTFKD